MGQEKWSVGKRTEGQKPEPENQVPKTKWWCVFSTQLFSSLSTLVLSVATILFYKIMAACWLACSSITETKGFSRMNIKTKIQAYWYTLERISPL